MKQIYVSVGFLAVLTTAGGIYLANSDLTLSEIKDRILMNQQEMPQAPLAKKKSEFVNTEGTDLPEIIVDEKTLGDVPENEEKEVDFEEVDEENKELEDVSVDDAVKERKIPDQINLAIPFYAQAPDADRTLPWKEACEEASVILAAYFMNEESLSKKKFKEEVLALVDLQKQMFGDYIDTNIEETAELFEEYYGIGRTEIIDNPSVEDLKYHLAQGHPIIAPFAGRLLGNSHFTGGGPRYHMLVIRGYDEEYFYTNDVGTKHGKNFPYTYDVLMYALHDLVPQGEGDIEKGEKRVLVLTK